MFSLIYILDVFFFVCLFWKIKIIIIKPYRASHFSSKLWEVFETFEKKNIYFILFVYLVNFLNMNTLWTSCSLYETQFHSVPFHPINPSPSHPIPFYSIFTFLFYSILWLVKIIIVQPSISKLQRTVIQTSYVRGNRQAAVILYICCSSFFFFSLG